MLYSMQIKGEFRLIFQFNRKEWNGFLLEKNLVSETYEAFGRELELIRKDYDIDVNELTVKQTKMNKKIYYLCMDIELHKRDK